MENSNINRTKLARLSAIGLILAICAAIPLVTSVGQRRSKEKPPKVTGISSRKVANGEVISLSTDGELNGIQTWQDPDGSFHLVLPGSGESAVASSPGGVKVRRVGNSLEVEVQAKRGSSVTVESGSNRLDLVVTGGVESRASAGIVNVNPVKAASVRRVETPRSASTRSASAPSVQSSPKGSSSKSQAPVVQETPVTPQVVVAAASPPSPAPQIQPSAPLSQTEAELPAVELEQQNGFSPLAFLSGWWVTIVLIIWLVVLVIRRRRDKSGWVEMEEASTPDAVALPEVEQTINSIVGESRQTNRRNNGRPGGQRSGDGKGQKHESYSIGQTTGHSLESQLCAAVPAPATLFGAYRVDQEVGKLVLGQPHRIDVLTSRSVDDRRAMEASLLKALRSRQTNDDGRRKARQALEDYGFVARQSAAVLLGQDSCERVTAARFLGEVGLSSSLQFLLEALYDTDTIVRTQAVESIGALKLPSAIGALLDIARRYPDVSSSALSSALNACSIECFGTLDSKTERPEFLLTGGGSLSSEITQLEPSATFHELPESSEDEQLVDTLALLQSTDPDARASAAQTLALYRVQRSVSALKALTTSDTEPVVRAAAVASLGAIDHESVFSAVLVGLADEARDVRAAAARAVSRLSFDRADAYARVIEVSDLKELSDVAGACVKTGLAAQALERLASDDRRQAYEAFSLLSLLVRAGECQPILDVIEKHAEFKMCSAAIQLLGNSGRSEVAGQLRRLAELDGMPEQLRTELLEVISRVEQMQPA